MAKNYIIQIECTKNWILSHRNDDILPIDKLKKYVSNKVSDKYSIVDSSYSLLVLDVNTESSNDIEKIICDFFLKEYELDIKLDQTILLSVKEKEESKVDSESSSDESKTNTSNDVDQENVQPEDKKDEAQEIDAVIAEVDELVGCKEYIDLVNEIIDIAPQIKANNTANIFLSQSYLFAINNGYGLENYLSLLLKVIKASGMGINDVGKYEIVKAVYNKNDLNSINQALPTTQFFQNPSLDIYCIDISEWIGDLNTKEFKSFLQDLQERANNRIIVFSVPFVEKEVLERIDSQLNDVLFVKTISFPPYTKDEIQKIFFDELSKYHFTMNSDALPYFEQMIIKEKKDGKFYGTKTIQKVTKEILYNKQLFNARNKINTTEITKDEMASFVKGDNVIKSAEQMLNELIGAEKIKEKILEVISQIKFAMDGNNKEKPSMHMRFVGNPGTGKTTVARIIGKMLKDSGVLRVGDFFEYSGRDFVGRYIGETAPKTSSMCRDAYGSVLFIDEAYSLYRSYDNERDFGREALDTLIAEMENHRSDLLVIMAGYPEEMDLLMQGNIGMEGRMTYTIEFPNYSQDQLYEIFVKMMNERVKYDEKVLESAKTYFTNLSNEVISSRKFSNARFVRNLYERTCAKAALRCQLNSIKEVYVYKEDFEKAILDREFRFETVKKTSIGFNN